MYFHVLSFHAGPYLFIIVAMHTRLNTFEYPQVPLLSERNVCGLSAKDFYWHPVYTKRQ